MNEVNAMTDETVLAEPVKIDDINNDYDFNRFLRKPGLLVLDVYTEWCGPCLALARSLNRFKGVLGSKLHLATCKSDTITALHRFHRKSEPTWLFVTHGRAVNLMFGANVPRLLSIIECELQLLNTPERRTYSISQLQPEEEARQRKRSSSSMETIGDELNERSKNVNYGTDGIVDKLTQIDVMLFGQKGDRQGYVKAKKS